MNLPPFPSLPSSPQERLRLVEYGEICTRMERERCAKICDEIAAEVEDESPHKNYDLVALDCAAAIRSEAKQE